MMLQYKIGSSPAAAVLAYCFSSMNMTLVKKYVTDAGSLLWSRREMGRLTRSGAWWFGEKAIVGAVAILILKRFGLMANLRPYETKKARAWFPISLLLVGMIYTSIRALQFLSVPVYTIFKNLTIIVIAYGEALGFGALLSFALMVLSFVTAAWADIQSVVASAGEDDDDGMESDVAATMSTLIAGVMVKADLKNIDVMFYNNLLSIPILLLCSAFLEDWSASNVQKNFPAPTRTHLGTGMLYSGLVAILISYCTPWCIRATSSTTYAMAGALNKLPVAVLGIVFFAGPVSAAGAGAIFIGVLSGVVYAWEKTRERSQPVGKPILPLQVARLKS
ncbi:GDP-mannose transporter [Apiospora hydei]|uniref:GDP-mannose transporter n=1 Tax=Apiospora hydei TaxID=1337664 RepID=A0ABR1VX14_9PEZI